ncbi:dehydrogenase [Paractinoplanes abujensis]|uniref:NAD(P)-dependent dehydrogenase (Short-subunit alcohol dehydrogenase family) n=1 Tax=Paractinoplanes abujensis TaxID=882441 RepID=A0A7W7G7C0_9ACTN|nr:SDR family NAD(P)-dependent oxidoreductase [Actinoplanes abujensis]MBB4696836.1 NAD(P)-dependent dehydrogenase (short-subunit alcohol dehydrogenase family) [Actinoplanes abujensis]GID18698.1 dehydrogenase [Actinoplanes abujensis]
MKRVVVTGAGGGIGAALARRFAAQGAEVIVNDLDPAAAEAVASEIGGLPVPGDAANEDDTRRLIDTAWAELGGIDLFCANAGVLSAGDENTPDEVWTRDFAVNMMSHVYVTRALLPRWLDQGEPKRLVITVSAAGLLSLLGSAPYAVTKHAALAYAEWLRATYGHRGVVVQALCPQGVRTDMLTRGNARGSASAALLAESALEPDAVAAKVDEALAGDSFLILPHPEVAEFYRLRASDTDRWLGGMNKMQRAFEGGPR